MTRGPRLDLFKNKDGQWQWRMWGGSRKVAPSQGYVRRSAAIYNMEFVTGGEFRKTSTPDAPIPFGNLYRVAADGTGVIIPVRLLS